MRGGGVEDFFHVVIERVAAKQKPASGMGDDLRVGIFDGREEAFGHGRAVEVEIGVHGADHDVELREDFVGVIEPAVLEDVHFGAGEDVDAEAVSMRARRAGGVVRGVDFLDVRGHAPFVEAIGDGDGFRVIGDGDVFVAEGAGGGGHFFDGVFAVAGGRVPLEAAFDVFEADGLRQAVLFGGGNFAGVFAQLRRNVVELGLRVNFPFGTAGDALFAL